MIQYAFFAVKGHRLRAGLCLLGISIGAASVILLTSLGDGARRYVIGEFSSLGGNLLIVMPGKVETTGGFPTFGGTENDLTIGDALAIKKSGAHVRMLTPVAVGTELVSRGERGREVAIFGSTRDLMQARQLETAMGRFLPAMDMDRGARVCVLGYKLHRELFGNENPVGEKVRIGDWRFRVIGVMKNRGTSLGMDMDDTVIIPVATCLKMFNKRSLFRILIHVTHFNDLEVMKKEVSRIIKGRHNGEDDITMITQDAVLNTFTQILKVMTGVLVGIAAISLSVAGLGIMNVMLVSVSERKDEVGLLRALGATRPQVLSVFLAEAVMICLVGCILGLAVGYACGMLSHHLGIAIEMRPPWWAAAATFLISMLIGSLFGVLPARKAARLDPVTCLSGR